MIRVPLFAALLLAVPAAGCAGDDAGEGDGAPARTQPPAATRPLPPPAAAAGDLFSYDADAPVRLRRGELIGTSPGVEIRAVSFPSPRGGTVKGLLVTPTRAATPARPAVVYLHGAGGDRTQLIGPAVLMAQRGAVALTIDSAFTRARGRTGGEGVERVRRQRDLEAHTVVDLRRALDVLRDLPRVDPRRLAFVGFSAGARTGALLVGVDKRLRAAVLISGGAAPVTAYLADLDADTAADVEPLLESVDPLRYVARAAPAELLVQAGRRDRVVPRAALEALIRAASRPKTVRWYDAGHEPTKRWIDDQVAWLSERLGLDAAG